MAAYTFPGIEAYDETNNLGPNLGEYYNTQLNNLGVPGLQKTVQTFKDQTYHVGDLLSNLTKDISARTKGSLTSQAQADRMSAVEGGALRDQLSRLGVASQPATDALTSALGLADKSTGFYEQDRASRLSVILDKIHRGQAITDQEKSFAHSASLANANKLDINSALEAWMNGNKGSSGHGNASALDSPNYVGTNAPGTPVYTQNWDNGNGFHLPQFDLKKGLGNLFNFSVNPGRSLGDMLYGGASKLYKKYHP